MFSYMIYKKHSFQAFIRPYILTAPDSLKFRFVRPQLNAFKYAYKRKLDKTSLILRSCNTLYRNNQRIIWFPETFPLKAGSGIRQNNLIWDQRKDYLWNSVCNQFFRFITMEDIKTNLLTTFNTNNGAHSLVQNLWDQSIRSWGQTPIGTLKLKLMSVGEYRSGLSNILT